MPWIFSFLLIFAQIDFGFAASNEKRVTLYLFWARGCPHCEEEIGFLNRLQPKYSYLDIQKFEITDSRQNGDLLEKMSQDLHFEASGIPVTIIGSKYFIGFQDDETTGKSIEEAIIDEHQKKEPASSSSLNHPSIPKSIHIPFMNHIQIQSLSLPVLSIVLGAIDGFNPCAMWVLIMLLSFLIGIHDRKKLIVLGCLFLFASAFVYFLFLVAWLKFMLFVSYIPVIKISIGIFAFVVGCYYLKEFWANKEGVCKVTNSQQKKFISEKLAYFVTQKQFFFAVVAVIVLAFLVNSIELVCSAGIPAIYTQILALNHLSSIQYYFYILVYIFFFMLDDIIVFLIAIISLNLMNITSKYCRYSHLIGGFVLVAIGILLVFKPEWLMLA